MKTCYRKTDMNPSLIDARKEGFQRGMVKLAQTFMKKALVPTPGMVSPAAKALAQAMGKKVVSEFSSPSLLSRFGARLSSGDNQLYEVLRLLKAKPGWVAPGQLDDAYEALGHTALKRREMAKRVGYGGLGAGAAGGIALGVGNQAGGTLERRRVGEELKQTLAKMPLGHRTRLALSTLFAPDNTGEKFRDAIQAR